LGHSLYANKTEHMTNLYDSNFYIKKLQNDAISLIFVLNANYVLHGILLVARIEKLSYDVARETERNLYGRVQEHKRQVGQLPKCIVSKR